MNAPALNETIAYLDSPAAAAAIEADPYWPKWDSPWWRMTLLHELGLASAIPGRIVAAMVRGLATHYLPSFPFRLDELPPGVDPRRHLACHCALGTMFQVLSACGVDVDAELPWIRRWFLEYQLPDGGLNCDEAAYTRATPRSSMVSTLPPLEAILHCTRRQFTAEEERFLDRGARYLIERRLCRSVSRGGALIDPDWLEPCFPRFYFYDVLRGLAFLAAWSERRGRALPSAALEESLSRLRAIAGDAGGELVVGRRAWEGAWNQQLDREWAEAPARSFPLLEETSRVGEASPPLTREWRTVLARLGAVSSSELLG
jgi:hypothetical protein